MKTLKILSATILALFVMNSFVFGQEWKGAPNTTDPIFRTGNVGIGTTKPKGKLHVDGGVSGSGKDKDIILKARDTTPATGAVDGGNIILQPGKPGGAVDTGIGKDGKVDVRGNLYVTGRGFNAANRWATVYLGDANHYIRSTWGAGVSIGTYRVGDAITVSQGSGDVGIGMKPDRKLSVNGAIGLKRVDVWDGKNNNDLTWDGYTITREGSSRRYKQNIRPFQENFHDILKLEVKQYQMKEGYGDTEKWLFGYIAEDLEEVGLTKLVTHDAEGRPDGIKYKKIAIYLNEILKEHHLAIKEFQAKNHALMERIEALEAMVK